MNPDTDELLELCCAEISAVFQDTEGDWAEAKIPADGLYVVLAHGQINAPAGLTRALTDEADTTDYNQSVWQTLPFEGFDFENNDWSWDPAEPTRIVCEAPGLYRVTGTGLFQGGAIGEGLFVRMLLDGVGQVGPTCVAPSIGFAQFAMSAPLAIAAGSFIELQAENVGATSMPITIAPGGDDRPQLLLEVTHRGRDEVGTITLSLHEANGDLVRGIDSIATNDYIESVFGGLFSAKAGQLVQVRGTGPEMFSGLVGALDVWRIGDLTPWVSCAGDPPVE